MEGRWTHEQRSKKNNQRPNGNNNNENDIKGRRILFLVLAALIATLLINTLYTSISSPI